jgi:hypothetical protein
VDACCLEEAFQSLRGKETGMIHEEVFEHLHELAAPAANIKLLHQNPPPRPKDSADLSNGNLCILDVVKRIHAQHDIEPFVLEGDLLGTAKHDLDTREE